MNQEFDSFDWKAFEDDGEIGGSTEEDSSAAHARDLSAMVRSAEEKDRAVDVAQKANGAAQRRNLTIKFLAEELADVCGQRKALWARLTSEIAQRKHLVEEMRSLRGTIRVLQKEAQDARDAVGEQASRRAVAEEMLASVVAHARTGQQIPEGLEFAIERVLGDRARSPIQKGPAAPIGE